jgi:ribonuclease P protein component
MLRQFRLRESAEFEHVKATGRSLRHPLVTMGVAPNGLPHLRLGFVISKRIGNAVVRNRVRRVMREIMRLWLPLLKPGYDIVLVPRNELISQPYIEVKAALHQLINRAQLWREEAES